MKTRLSKSLLLAFYGDDFTGSTDVMESLSCAGLKTVLFLNPPTSAQLSRFSGLRSFGIAGRSRALSPAQMDRELPPVFEALKASAAAFIHYKVCSTLDSSASTGSIGRAIELARRVFGDRITPLVVGAPILGRCVVFGNLFARSGLDSELVRLDRHPTMRSHPVTPMNEADVRQHLAAQTNLPFKLVDVLSLDGAKARGRTNRAGALRSRLKSMAAMEPAPVVVFDTLHQSDLAVVGDLLASQRPPGGQAFCVGSSGLEYALVAHWRATGKIRRTGPYRSKAVARGQIITVSGSCSPVTDRQIAVAAKHGFVEVACDTGLLAKPGDTRQAVTDALERGRLALQAGKNVIFHTARGPEDPRRLSFQQVAKGCPGRGRAEKLAFAGECLSRGLALILEGALSITKARRAVVCGGDSSTVVARALGAEALTFVAPVAPGGPLCRVHAPGRIIHDCEVVFKGGQVGRDSFFPDLAGKASA